MLKSDLIGLLETLPDGNVVVEMTYFDENVTQSYRTAWYDITAARIGSASFGTGMDKVTKQAILIAVGNDETTNL